DRGHRVRVGGVGGHGQRGDVVGQLVEAPRHAEQRPHRVRGLDQAADDDDPFGDHQAPAAGPVGAPVGGGQVAEVVDPGIGGVRDSGDGRHGPHRGRVRRLHRSGHPVGRSEGITTGAKVDSPRAVRSPPRPERPRASSGAPGTRPGSGGSARMGQDVDRRTFSRRDRQRYRTKVQRCIDALAILLREHPFAPDEPMTGLEVELNLVGHDLAPSLAGADVLDAIGSSQFQSELGRWNLELNLPPRPLPGDEWRHLERHLLDELAVARAKAVDCSAQLAVIGILPTLERHHLVVEALSPDQRYATLNEQMLNARGEPIRLDIAGDDPSGRHGVAPEHLQADFDSIAPEAACTSMQLHLQVHPDSFAGYWNAAQCLAGVQLAVGANSPFLLGSRLWAETRIPLFEQSCDVRTPELRNQGVRPRVWFGERWITSILDLFSENARYFPALMPVTQDGDPMED